ncbi:beta-ketoacyl-[acyl-carrier-protein] synthase family protein [Mucilaginibacter boryungensis]|uniref:beta-ketoacyl-[acyl-carrier-protein] synthase family protein n=1 Tax=Mucilaginibacter boryungensis TaxID=768480 RepID=UPI001D169F52|nr:beta-ketoacyl synthase N-terminal-like domain-containing protein [Mucilaginibacter boryungensis]
MIINNPGVIPDVYIVADNILSPIGKTTNENLQSLKQNISAVKHHTDLDITPDPIAAALFEPNSVNIVKNYTKFENLLISSISDVINQLPQGYLGDKTVLIVSSTKGNISLLETEKHTEALNNRMALHTSAQLVTDHFGFVNKPIIISNACISGVMAILTGMRLIQSGQYENAVVAGADVISKFVLSGFQSFQALSSTVCRPFDKERTGLNLGEGAATVVLSSRKQNDTDVKVSSGAISNDANHISGPSRTGEELGFAIKKALLDAGITAHDVDYISTHGTATNYNDEMEANAINFAGLQHVLANSLKGYYGHTLGAAGLIESIIATYAIKDGLIFPSLGYAENGVSKPINICTQLTHMPVKHVLKTASGFGGCNAAMIFSK